MEEKKIVDLVPGEEVKDEETKTEEVKEEKVSIFKRVGRAIVKPVKYVGRKLKESPASACFGAIGGAGLALGGKVLYDHFAGKRASLEYEDIVDDEDDEEQEMTTDENDVDEAM